MAFDSDGMSREGRIAFPAPSDARIDEGIRDRLAAIGPGLFMPYDVIGDADGALSVSVEAPAGPSLAESLARPVAGEVLLGLLSGLAGLIDICRQQGLPLANLALGTDRIFGSSEPGSFRFAYLPFPLTADPASAMRSLLASVVQLSRPADAIAEGALERLGSYLGRHDVTDLIGLSAFLGALAVEVHGAEKQPMVPQPSVDPEAGTQLIDDALMADAPSSALPGNPGTTVLDGLFAAPSQGADAEPTACEGVAAPAIAPPAAIEEPAMPQGTSVLNAVDFNDADALARLGAISSPEEDAADGLQGGISGDQPAQPVPFSLIHQRSGERIALFGADFIVGKSKRASYQVLGTSTVSRLHARFICEGGSCWVEDNGSLNGTFLNGRKLSPNQRELLADGDSLRLADEAFTFQATRGGR